MSEDLYVINDILTERESVGLAMDILAYNIVCNKNLHKQHDDVHNICCGVNLMPQRATNLYDGVTEMVQHITGIPNLKQSSMFGRIYRNGSILPPHTDREDLDWTLSVTLFSSLQSRWPLKVQLLDGKIVDQQNQIGGGALFKARNLTHWRDKLECSEYEFSVHLFMHWKET